MNPATKATTNTAEQSLVPNIENVNGEHVAKGQSIVQTQAAQPISNPASTAQSNPLTSLVSREYGSSSETTTPYIFPSGNRGLRPPPFREKQQEEENQDMTAKIADKLLAFKNVVPLRSTAPLLPPTAQHQHPSQNYWSQKFSLPSMYSNVPMNGPASTSNAYPPYLPSQFYGRRFSAPFSEMESDHGLNSKEAEEEHFVSNELDEERRAATERLKRLRSSSEGSINGRSVDVAAAATVGSGPGRKKKSRADRDKQMTTDPCVICKQFCPKRCYQAHHYLEDYKIVFPNYDGTLGKVCPGCYYKCYAYRQSRTRKQSIDKTGSNTNGLLVSAAAPGTENKVFSTTVPRRKSIKRERQTLEENLVDMEVARPNISPSLEEPMTKKQKDEIIERLKAALEEKDIVIQFLRNEIAVTKEKLEALTSGGSGTTTSAATSAPVASCVSQPYSKNNYATLGTL